MIEISQDSIRDNLKKFINDNEPAPNTPEGVAVCALMIASQLLRQNKTLVMKMKDAILKSDIPIESQFIFLLHILALVECAHDEDEDEE